MTSFSDLIRNGSTPIGTQLSTSSIEVADLMAGCGFDWLFLDAEHGAISLEDVPKILSVVQGRVPVLVRLPDHQEIWIKKALDAGADGIIVPQVNSAEAATQVVAAAKYPPFGARSVGIGRAHRYGQDFAGYIANANVTTSVIVQIEHKDGVDNIESILAVDGIDGVFIGPYDLSGSLDCLGDITNPSVQEAIVSTRAECAKVGMPVGIFGLTAEAGLANLEAGFDFMIVGIDLPVLGAAARQIMATLRPS